MAVGFSTQMACGHTQYLADTDVATTAPLREAYATTGICLILRVCRRHLRSNYQLSTKLKKTLAWGRELWYNASHSKKTVVTHRDGSAVSHVESAVPPDGGLHHL